MVDAAAILARLRGERDAMIAETTRLASIDSGRGAAAGLARARNALGARLIALGFEVAASGEGGLTATTGDARDCPRTLVVGHADTVWPAGTAAGWPVRREGSML